MILFTVYELLEYLCLDHTYEFSPIQQIGLRKKNFIFHFGLVTG